MAFVVLAGTESLAFGQTAPPSAAGSQPASTEAPARIKYDLLTFYKDNYFITGFTKSVEAKIQVSAKFDLWPNGTRSAVHLAFTSKLLWNIYRPSAPFAETNYNPEIFYTFFHHKDRYARPPGCGFFYERFGVEHESKGGGGEALARVESHPSRVAFRLLHRQRSLCGGIVKSMAAVPLA